MLVPVVIYVVAAINSRFHTSSVNSSVRKLKVLDLSLTVCLTLETPYIRHRQTSANYQKPSPYQPLHVFTFVYVKHSP